MGFLYQSFDEDLVTDLPSCVYANQHLTNSPSEAPIEAFVNRNNLGLCSINPTLRQHIQHQYNLHHNAGTKTIF